MQSDLVGLSDQQLFERTALLVRHERRTTADVMRHLMEIDLQSARDVFGDEYIDEKIAAQRARAAARAREAKALSAATSAARWTPPCPRSASDFPTASIRRR